MVTLNFLNQLVANIAWSALPKFKKKNRHRRLNLDFIFLCSKTGCRKVN